MTEIVGICENCDLPILGHPGQKKRNKHISRDVCFEIMRALIPQLKAENAQLKDQLQASNANLRVFVEKPGLLGDIEITKVEATWQQPK